MRRVGHTLSSPPSPVIVLTYQETELVETLIVAMKKYDRAAIPWINVYGSVDFTTALIHHLQITDPATQEQCRKACKLIFHDTTVNNFITNCYKII